MEAKKCIDAFKIECKEKNYNDWLRLKNLQVLVRRVYSETQKFRVLAYIPRGSMVIKHHVKNVWLGQK